MLFLLLFCILLHGIQLDDKFISLTLLINNYIYILFIQKYFLNKFELLFV